jgi:hypothetical protein
LSDAGLYDVVIYNGAGVTISAAATLQVLVPAAILTQPQGLRVSAGASATFRIEAVSSSPISYQWRKNGAAIPGANGTSYTINNVSVADEAAYNVLLTDAVGPVVSDAAALSVLVAPSVVRAPISQTVPAGGTAIFGIETAGTLPMGYRWRKGASTLRTDVLSSHTAFLVIENVQASHAGAYSVVLTNAAFGTPGVLVQGFSLVVVADTDHDGIPDSVEIANGWNPNDPNDVNNDSDGDGMSNGDEYIAGTDWNNPNSYLKIENLRPGPGVQFTTVSNRTYTIEFKNSLNDLAWSKLAHVAATTNSVLIVVPDTDGSPRRVYRLVTPTQP